MIQVVEMVLQPKKSLSSVDRFVEEGSGINVSISDNIGHSEQTSQIKTKLLLF